MTTHVWVLSVALAVAALLSWGALLRDDYELSRISRPTFQGLVIGLAWSLYTDGRAPTAPTLPPLLIALGLSLVGDLFLLNQTRHRYRLGVSALLLANAALIWATYEIHHRGQLRWPVAPALLVVVLLHGLLGRDVVRHSGPDRGIVFLSLVLLVGLVLLAAYREDWTVLGATLLLLVSAQVLGHDRFVRERRLAPVLSLACQQGALVAVVVGFLR